MQVSLFFIVFFEIFEQEEKNFCYFCCFRFGLNCWYAHGPVELRHVPRLDKDPVATSISLAEVLQKLPPSRDFCKFALFFFNYLFS